MNALDDIISGLAIKGHASLIEVEKPKKEASAKPSYNPRDYATGPSIDAPNGRAYNEHRPPKVWPSERMGAISSPSSKAIPKRAPFNMFSFSDEDIDFAFSVKVKRGWTFEQWLEVIGFPPDLHPKLDGATYSYAERAFLKLKREAHNR